jgi:hypothetical protein
MAIPPPSLSRDAARASGDAMPPAAQVPASDAARLGRAGGRRERARQGRHVPSLEVTGEDAGTPGALRHHGNNPATATASEQAPADTATPDPEEVKPKPANGFVPDEVDFSLDGKTDVPEAGYVGGSNGTMSLWLQPEWAEGNQDDATLAQLGNVLQLVKNVNYLRFELLHDQGMLGVGAPVTAWQPGEWHLVTATWSGNQLSLFLDGQLVNQTVQSIQIDLPRETTLSVGSDFPESRPVAPGTIGRVGLWRRPLDPEEIAAFYKTGTENQ